MTSTNILNNSGNNLVSIKNRVQSISNKDKIHELVDGKFSRAHGLQCPLKFHQLFLIFYLIFNHFVTIQSALGMFLKIEEIENSDTFHDLISKE